MLNKVNIYKAAFTLFSAFIFTSCGDDSVIDNHTGHDDIITPFALINDTRLSMGNDGAGVFETGDSISVTGSSRSAWYVLHGVNWISKEPLRWSEETPDNNNLYGFKALYKGKTSGESNQTPTTLFSYSHKVPKNSNITFGFVHVDAKMQIEVEIPDDDIEWNENTEVYINDVMIDIYPYVDSKGEIKAYATGERNDVLMTTCVKSKEDDLNGYNFNGAIANIAPGQSITSVSISTENGEKYFSIQFPETGPESFIPLAGQQNVLKMKLISNKK